MDSRYSRPPGDSAPDARLTAEELRTGWRAQSGRRCAGMMSASRDRMRQLPIVAILVALSTGAVGAIDLDVTQEDIEQVLAVARGTQAERDAFHAPYLIAVPQPQIERLEVITERRRLALIAAERIALGEAMFARGTMRAIEALRPWRRKVAIVARFAFPPNSAYVLAPPVDILLADGPAPLDVTSETLFGMGSGDTGQALPVVGARGEAIFDAEPLAEVSRTIVIRLGDRGMAQVRVDFGRLD